MKLLSQGGEPGEPPPPAKENKTRAREEKKEKKNLMRFKFRQVITTAPKKPVAYMCVCIDSKKTCSVDFCASSAVLVAPPRNFL